MHKIFRYKTWIEEDIYVREYNAVYSAETRPTFRRNSSGSLPGLFFDSEDGGSIFLQYVGWHSMDYTALW
jgi:hypothetical protein